jgi:hypothetical protein
MELAEQGENQMTRTKKIVTAELKAHRAAQKALSLAQDQDGTWGAPESVAARKALQDREWELCTELDSFGGRAVKVAAHCLDNGVS